MSIREESVPRPSPLTVIIPTVILLGFMVYFGFAVWGSEDPAYFYAVGVAAAFTVYVLTFANVILGISILIASIGLSPEFSLAGIRNLRLEDFVVPALAAAWLTRAMKSREPTAPSRVRGPALVYLASMALSSAMGIMGGSTSLHTSLLYFGKFVEYFLIFLIVVNNVKTERDFKALALLSLLIGIAGGFMGAVRMGGIDEDIKNRLQGPLGETSTIFGGYLLLNLSMALGFFLNARTQANRTAAASATSLLFIAILYTFSRTTYAALAVGLATFAGLKNRRLLIIILALLVAFPLLAPENIWQRAATIGTVFTESRTPSWMARVSAWNSALGNRVAASPLLGSGLGSVRLGDIDNDYIRMACDLGILGLGIFLWMIFRLGRVANGVYESLPPACFHKGFMAGYLMGLFGLAVHAIGATSFTSIRTMEQFMFLSGLMVCLANNREAWMEEAALRGEDWTSMAPFPRAV